MKHEEENTMAQAAVASVEPTTEVALAPADPMISMIERVALDPSADISKLEKMMEMKERLEDRQLEKEHRASELEFNAALSAAQSEMPTVEKTRENGHTHSKYADLADIEQAAMPVAYKHGFAVSFTPAGANEKGEILIKWTLSHKGGHTRQDTAGFPLDAAGAKGGANKTGIQAMGSTMTYARRYLLCNLFNIATGDDNDGNAQASTISAEEYIALRDLIEEAGADEERLLAFAKVENLEELPRAKLRQVQYMLNQKINAKGGANA